MRSFPQKLTKASAARILCALWGLAAAGEASAIPRFTDEGFRVPQPGREFTFPRDHGSHPDYKIEWWYLTGHLFGENDGRFGFQATFFRVGARAPGDAPAFPSTAFGDGELHMAHMAVVDEAGDRFFHEERLHRGGFEAHASTETLDVRNGNWTLRMLDPDTETMRLRFTVRGGVRVDLVLVPEKPLTVFGEDGTSRKGAAPAARSHYLTFTRIAAQGSLEIGGEKHAVSGVAWMDHEIASEQLSPDLEGWDWTAIHLFDGREIKAYILRRPDGTPDPYSAWMWIDGDNNVTHLDAESFRWERKRFWTSPQTGASYPVEVTLTAPDPVTGTSTALRLVPIRDAQEITGELGGTTYWEGAMRVLDAEGNTIGHAYMELVGYDAPVGDRLR